MATLKHIASKNSDYTAIEAYLVYQHDAFTGKQLLDEQGRPKLRESYLLDTLECGDFSFATACLLANRKYRYRLWSLAGCVLFRGAPCFLYFVLNLLTHGSQPYFSNILPARRLESGLHTPAGHCR